MDSSTPAVISLARHLLTGSLGGRSCERFLDQWDDVLFIAEAAVELFQQLAIDTVNESGRDSEDVALIQNVVADGARQNVCDVQIQFGQLVENFFLKFLRRFAFLIVVNVQRNRFNSLRILLLQLQKVREVQQAMASPQGPQIDDDDFAFVTGDQLVRFRRIEDVK